MSKYDPNWKGQAENSCPDPDGYSEGIWPASSCPTCGASLLLDVPLTMRQRALQDVLHALAELAIADPAELRVLLLYAGGDSQREIVGKLKEDNCSPAGGLQMSRRWVGEVIHKHLPLGIRVRGRPGGCRKAVDGPLAEDAETGSE